MNVSWTPVIPYIMHSILPPNLLPVTSACICLLLATESQQANHDVVLTAGGAPERSGGGRGGAEGAEGCRESNHAHHLCCCS